jgi:hypothetical protein
MAEGQNGGRLFEHQGDHPDKLIFLLVHFSNIAVKDVGLPAHG